MATKKTTYVERDDYFPEEIRKKYGLGEYNEEVNKKIDEIEKEIDNRQSGDDINQQ